MMPSISSSVSTSFFPLAFVKVTSKTVPVISSPVYSSVKRIFKSFSTETKLTLTLPDAVSEVSSSVEEASSVLKSCAKAPDSAAPDIASSPSSPATPIFLSSPPSGASAAICLSTALDCKNMPNMTIPATRTTTPVAARTASKAVR